MELEGHVIGGAQEIDAWCCAGVPSQQPGGVASNTHIVVLALPLYGSGVPLCHLARGAVLGHPEAGLYAYDVGGQVNADARKQHGAEIVAADPHTDKVIVFGHLEGATDQVAQRVVIQVVGKARGDTPSPAQGELAATSARKA